MRERRIAFDELKNCRDLGGIPAGSGKEIRFGLMFRSAGLFVLSERDKAKLKEECRLCKVIDLRTPVEQEQKPDVRIDGVEYKSMPILTERKIGLTHEDADDDEKRMSVVPDMACLYSLMVEDEETRTHLAEVLTEIMTHDFSTGSILWHCTEGKDRCGLVSALIEYILGSRESSILEDYLITNEVNGPKSELVFQQLINNGAEPRKAGAVREAFLAKEEYLFAAVSSVSGLFGTMDRFFTEGLHISEEMVQNFRDQAL